MRGTSDRKLEIQAAKRVAQGMADRGDPRRGKYVIIASARSPSPTVYGPYWHRHEAQEAKGRLDSLGMKITGTIVKVPGKLSEADQKQKLEAALRD